MDRLLEYKKRILDWANERGLINPDNAEKQKLKFFEEYGEYCGHYIKGKDTKDDIGDMYVVAVILEAIVKTRWETKPAFSGSTNLLPASLVLSNNFDALYIVLDSIAKLNGHKLIDCVAHAYIEIKDRKGKMVNGSFIKEEDLSKINT